MTSFQDKLEQKYASARALLKAAGEDCDVEKANSPEALIGNAADVQVTDNLPAGVEVPGAKGMETDGETAEDRGTDVGHVETNGPAPEDNEGNKEVAEIISVAEHVTKHASAVASMAQEALKLAESAFSGMAKKASAEPTDADVERYIVKQAAAGNPIMQGIVAYCQNWHAHMSKQASDEEEIAGAVEEGADIEAAAAEAQQQVAQTLMSEGMDEAQAMEVAGQAVADVIEGNGGDEGITEEDAIEAAEILKEKLIAAGMPEGEAEQTAIESIAQVLDGGSAPAEMGKEASAKPAEAPKTVEKKAAGEEVVEEAVEEAAPAEEAPVEEAAVAEAPVEGAAEGAAEVNAVVGELVEGLATEIKAQDPEIGDEEAKEAAVEQVNDALETVQAQQAIGAVGEDGAPVVSDADTEAAVAEMEKSASAFPLRGVLATAINMKLGLSPEAFAARLNIQ